VIKMPKSRLKIEGLQLSDIESLQATKTEVSVGIVNGVKAPRFIQEEVSPSIRQTGSLQTDEVEYDTHVKWTITKAVLVITWPPPCVNPTTSPLPCSSSETPSDMYYAEPYTYDGLDGYVIAPGGYIQFGSQDSLVYTDEIWFWAIGCPDDKIVIEAYIVDFQTTSTKEVYMNGDWVQVEKVFASGGTKGWFTLKAPSSNGYAVFVHCVNSGGTV